MTAYTHGHESSVVAAHARRTAANSCAYLLPHLGPGMSLLDVGCGPGTITLDLARVVAPGRVVGLEKVAAPVEIARAAAAEQGDAQTVFEIGDVADLAYADASFDVTHAHQVLQHLGDPVAALREMARVTRPGGIVAVRDVDYASMTWFPRLPGMDLWLATYRAMAHANGAEPDAGPRLRAWANAAGLADVSVTASAWVYATTDATTWWGSSQADRLHTNAFVSQAQRAGLSEADILSMAADWRSWGEQPEAYFAMMHTEVIARIPGGPVS